MSRGVSSLDPVRLGNLSALAFGGNVYEGNRFGENGFVEEVGTQVAFDACG
jgi:hypothetical protein